MLRRSFGEGGAGEGAAPLPSPSLITPLIEASPRLGVPAVFCNLRALSSPRFADGDPVETGEAGQDSPLSRAGTGFVTPGDSSIATQLNPLEPPKSGSALRAANLKPFVVTSLTIPRT